MKYFLIVPIVIYLILCAVSWSTGWTLDMPLSEQICVLTGGHKLIKNELSEEQEKQLSNPGWCRDYYYCMKCKRLFDLTPAYDTGSGIMFTSCPELWGKRAGYTPKYFKKSGA